MEKLGDTLNKKQFEDRHKNVSEEFQRYGYELAKALGDPRHKGLYIKYAKELPRDILEKAKSYALDYPKAESKAKIFMLKLKDLRGGKNAH